MLDFLKKIIRSEEKKAAVAIDFSAIPARLEEEKEVAAARLMKASEKERATIRTAADQLHAVINTLLAAELNEDLHPKLKSIAKKSLPQYARAIAAALEKPLPDDAPAFYAAAAELLKTCISSATGQGKYLRTVFPEEMKDVSACVADIGRAINAMNGPIMAYREEMDRITEALRVHAALSDIGTDLAHSSEKEVRMARRIVEIEGRVAACRESLGELEREMGRSALDDREREISALKDEHERTERHYATVSMTASHVLRRAAKVARHPRRPADETALARAILILSDHDIPQAGVIGQVLDAAFVPVERMIATGDVSLRNPDERTLFASGEAFSRGICNPCTQLGNLAASIGSAEAAFAAQPVVARHASLTRELQSLSGMLAKENAAREDLRQWREGVEKNIPVLRQQLEKVMGLIFSGSDVQIHFPD